ncbi:hypothetical protein A1Q1_04638 [Trichosporon asahii var. asahii CBS 2479]|uniref:Pre-mRNA-splicing factor SPF27 n=1 Tax=Trichosporon asahii var. asahii (strain ATCC 90039 / CBS 2479 / JCM 2466 / KCTC 7840 / NBRC 103889/ NCYC 2677 / UAMH 7654) TaxID=1186058 RepID=J5TRV9_TRIAS|nr:hypothetical protein A1Q1_04638 [Trichosporon asahii var. asahii CBS 2479]EJT52426.1 hypothetical protein A1Q1_04638 [Trichosporon asahii var. asahii CBS 2479]
MSGSAIDALPYIDKQVEDPAIKQKAQALIEAELAATSKVADDDVRLPKDVDVFPKSEELSKLLANYANEPIRGIDPGRYAPPAVNDDATEEELVAAEQRGRISEGHMDLRNESIGVMQSYGPNAWLVRNYQLKSQLEELQGTLARVKEDVTEVNRARRVAQEEAGEHLARLEGRWQDMVSSTVQLEMACMAMEGEVAQLRRKEEQLKSEVAALEG